MPVSFFGPSPLLANGFYIHNVFGFFFWQRNLVLARENPLTVKWISQFMSFEFNFVTLAGAPALSLFSLWPSSLGTFKWICFALLVSVSFSFSFWTGSASGSHSHFIWVAAEFCCGLWFRCLEMVPTFLGYNFLIFIYFYARIFSQKC